MKDFISRKERMKGFKRIDWQELMIGTSAIIMFIVLIAYIYLITSN